VTALRHLPVIVLSLALIGGNTAVCAGWAPTPEARMACCTDGACPMHQAGSHDSGSHHVVTQSQADACCAASEHEQSQSAKPTVVPAISAAILGAGVVLPASTSTLVLAGRWRTDTPVPIPPVARHVLLSVFLV
jgi:hypothetical protein